MGMESIRQRRMERDGKGRKEGEMERERRVGREEKDTVEKEWDGRKVKGRMGMGK